METTEVARRLADLRELMQREHLAAFIFPSADPHQSEYTADHWKGREWISGFNGSAGTAVVTMNAAALWTDSRYFLAAEEQLKGTEFQLMKLKVEGTPTIAEWIYTMHNSQCIMHHTQCMTHHTEVAIDGWCCATSEAKELIKELRQHGGYTLRTNLDPLKWIWKDRPPMPENPVMLHPLEYAGESTHEKLTRIRRALRQQHADGMLMTALDDIAWTLNLRGSDVHCNPVFVSYLLISSKDVTLFINRKKLSAEVEQYLKAEGIAVDDYENIGKGLQAYFEYNILLDPDEVNYALYRTVESGERREERGKRMEIVEAESPVKRMKAVKNATEMAGMRQAMLRDGIAMVKFLKELDEAYGTNGAYEANEPNGPWTELSVDRRLTALRAEQPLFRGVSFDTIAAYGEHGAIVHYEPTPETDIPLKPEGLLLLDSGAQYPDGTTDITRTIALGLLTDEMRRVYTLVLKGHLQLQNLHFPAGAAGTQLDAVARMAMWREGYNYLHGTGHGVGSYLNVHEGPHQIRMEWKPTPLQAGMTVTDEPGIYLAGRFGVRIENTLLIVPAEETECGKFLKFEPLTICPIDTRPIVIEMLTPEERQWLNDYHQMVYDRLSPHLTADEQEWLKEKCKNVKM